MSPPLIPLSLIPKLCVKNLLVSPDNYLNTLFSAFKFITFDVSYEFIAYIDKLSYCNCFICYLNGAICVSISDEPILAYNERIVARSYPFYNFILFNYYSIFLPPILPYICNPDFVNKSLSLYIYYCFYLNILCILISCTCNCNAPKYCVCSCNCNCPSLLL